MEEEFLYIDRFFNEELNENERNEFEQRCETDIVFAEEVASYLKVKYGFKKIYQEKRKADFEKIRKNYKEPILVIQRRNVWLAAASVAFFCLIGWWYMSNSKPDLEQLADEYMQENFASISSTMTSEKDKLQEGIGLFNTGKLEAANVIFDSLAAQNNAEALKYAGIAYLRLNLYDKAIKRFEALEKQPLKINSGMFYHAIALLKRKQGNDLIEAKKRLEKIKNQKQDGWQEIEKWDF